MTENDEDFLPGETVGDDLLEEDSDHFTVDDEGNLVPLTPDDSDLEDDEEDEPLPIYTAEEIGFDPDDPNEWEET